MKFPDPRKIDWLEKPKRWEVALMIIAGFGTCTEMLWLQNTWDQATAVHNQKMVQIYARRDFLLRERKRASSADSKRLREIVSPVVDEKGI